MSARKYFGTDGIRGRFGDAKVSPEFALRLGFAAGRVFAKRAHSTVVIGKDTRISGYVFEAALEAGFASAGVNVEMLGPMPTPAIAYLTRTFRASAGIVISASHNPYYDNGIKFFGPNGKKISDELELAIEAELDEPMSVVDSDALGRVHRINDAKGRYIEFCKSTAPFQLSLKGLKIVVDCGHGATYHIAPDVFTELGAKVIAMGVKPNGLNINHECGATHLDALQAAVLAEKADLGIAFDGDGDRVMMVDHTGEIVDGDELLYIIVSHERAMGRLSGGVVGTLMTNLAVEQAFQKDGIEFVRAKVGDRYVLAELEQRGWLFGGEGSGHIVCLNKTTTGDGIVSALQVLAAMKEQAQPLYDLRKKIDKCPMRMINVRVAKLSDPLAVPAVQIALASAEERLGEQGRVLLRASGTEPVIRVMVEANTQAMVDKEVEALAAVVKEAMS
ncbi:MAG: phosphoglucosamine mutase [Gammaproteobacteria bacterium CG11_big_fil_rev_8_21_14_0_20_46_22]|nr:MAG: phosphoglucosamine mutase [Gammaproteobacteria bacterium CG12_big_fil_rev_8_21_14_0_65_46_12]PIR11090.1 MAG: phosphoglucosamine mutase [Gammaproteobacteria bacterium CG11_big_fil_rev_8_21_14_0_20_46_22]